MTDSLWFITILKDQPMWGVAIGAVFFGLMFLVKHLIVRSLIKNEESD